MSNNLKGKISISFNNKTKKYKVSNHTYGCEPVYLGFIAEHKNGTSIFIFYVPNKVPTVDTVNKAITYIVDKILNTLGTSIAYTETDDKSYWRIFYE